MQYDEPREHIILGNEANPPRAGLHRERNGLAAPLEASMEYVQHSYCRLGRANSRKTQHTTHEYRGYIPFQNRHDVAKPSARLPSES